MGSFPLVSCVIIYLDAERHLDEAIRSVLAQTYQDWELLLVDDGSSDRGPDIARSYAEREGGRVRCLRHPGGRNRGMSASRNLGAAHARGEYLALLDADDVWLPGKLARQVELLRQRPEVEMVCGPTQWWYSWTGQPEQAQADSRRELWIKPDVAYAPPTLLTLLLERRIRTPATCSFLIRRRAFESVGGFEESFRGMYEDQAFFAKVYLELAIYVTDECWDLYRQHPESHCAVAEREGRYHPERPNLAQRRFLDWLDGYLAHHRVQEVGLRKALRQACLPYRHPVLHRLKGLASRLTRRNLRRR
jgi:glycosyltransferase involved in cell wall biosynthesis